MTVKRINNTGGNDLDRAEREVVAFITKAGLERRLVTYEDVSKAIKWTGFRPRDNRLHTLLGRILTKDIQAGRPISVVTVVNKGTGICGQGFFIGARQLAHRKGSDYEVWADELKRFHTYCQRKAK